MKTNPWNSDKKSEEYLFFSPGEFRVSGSVRNILVMAEFLHTAVLSLCKTGIKNVTNSDLSINVSYFFLTDSHIKVRSRPDGKSI